MKKQFFKKGLYSMSEFDAKPLSLARNCEHLAKHSFQPKMEKTHFSKKGCHKCHAIGGFDAKHIFFIENW